MLFWGNPFYNTLSPTGYSPSLNKDSPNVIRGYFSSVEGHLFFILNASLIF